MEQRESGTNQFWIGSTEIQVVAPIEKLNSSERAPIYLNVDTGIDYAAITTGSLGLVVAALAAWFTLSVQKNQIQANVSNLRHHWMTELRLCASEFLQCVSLLVNNLNTIENYKASEGYVELYSKVIILQAKIELLLSRNDKRSSKLRRKMNSLITLVKRLKYHERNPLVFAAMANLRDLFRSELEKAWTDVKDDLGINKKFFGIRFVTKKTKR